MQDCDKEQFKTCVMDTVKTVLGMFEDKLLYQAVKPIVNLALPKLEDMVNKEPQEVYRYLKMAQGHIEQAVKLYEADKP